MNEWIPVKGKDAGPEYPLWINPIAVVSARYWDDPAGRVLTLELLNGRSVQLREREALDHVGRLIGGGPAPEPDPEPVVVRCEGRRVGRARAA